MSASYSLLPAQEIKTTWDTPFQKPVTKLSDLQEILGNQRNPQNLAIKMERVMGFEPTTSCLGSKHSTAELHPQLTILYQMGGIMVSRTDYSGGKSVNSFFAILGYWAMKSSSSSTSGLCASTLAYLANSRTSSACLASSNDTSIWPIM